MALTGGRAECVGAQAEREGPEVGEESRRNSERQVT